MRHDTTTDDCPCHPSVEPVKRDDGSIGWLVTHRRERPHFSSGAVGECGRCGVTDVLARDPDGEVDDLTGEFYELACASCLTGYEDREDDQP